jgi:hypothetical protein
MNATSLRIAGSVVVSFLALACGDTSGSGGSGAGGGGTEPAATESISADSGGTVSDAEHAVTLDVPAGALSEDTEISLFIEPKQEDTATEVFVFQPDGLTLAAPASVTIDIFTIPFPEGQTVAFVQRDGADWIVLDSTFGSGTITASVTELGTFSTVYVNASSTGECDDACTTCCTTCGCAAEDCTPVCPAETPWDCEIGCCFNYDTLECAI